MILLASLVMKFEKLCGESFYLTEYFLFTTQPNTCVHVHGQAKGLTVYRCCGSLELQKVERDKAQFQVEFAALIQSFTSELPGSSPSRPLARAGRGSANGFGSCTPLRCAHRQRCAANHTGALLDVWRLQTSPVLDNRPPVDMIYPCFRLQGLLCVFALHLWTAGAPIIWRRSPTFLEAFALQSKKFAFYADHETNPVRYHRGTLKTSLKIFRFFC